MTEDLSQKSSGIKIRALVKRRSSISYGLLDKAEDEIEIEGDGENNAATSLTRRRIIRIRLALVDYYK